MSENTPAGLGPIDHVAVVVRDIDEALPRYRALLGLTASDGVQTITAQAVRLCFLPTGPQPAARIELIEPTDRESGVARFLESRGEGLHHVCFGTTDLAAELARLEEAGAELIDHAPRPGAEGAVAFVHPRTLNGVLWELLERDGTSEARRPSPPARAAARGSGGGVRDTDTGLAERLALRLGGARPTGDDGSGMAHPPARRRGPARDERGHRLGQVLGDVRRGALLLVAADLADEDHRIGIGVGLEQVEDLDEVGAHDRVAADPDAGGLADALIGQGLHDLVGQGAGTADHAHPSATMDVARNDPDLRLPDRRGARAVRAHQPDALPAKGVVHAQHVEGGDALGDAEDETDAGGGGFEHRIRGERRRDVDHARVGPRLADGLGHGVEDRDPAVERPLPALAGRHPGHDRRPVVEHGLAVELALPAGDALDQEPGVLVDEDAHAVTHGPGRGDRQLGGLVQAVGDLEVGLLEDERRLIGVGADDADHHRDFAVQPGPSLDDAVGHLVAAGDPAEDVDEHRPHVRVGEDDAERRRHPLVARPAADVEEVRRLAPGQLHEVHGGHGQAGAVHHAADGAVELDVADARRAGRDLGRLLLGQVAHDLDVGMAGERRVVDHHLGVEGEETAVPGHDHEG